LATKLHYEIDEEIELQVPKKYKVILLNDNYSTVEFVIQVLMQIFKKNLEEATAITMNIHENGRGVCGIYTYEIAQTKVAQVRANARKAEFPLKAIVEEE
jgi:ATP-dependent Clp protease adaptor protein ClpS